MLVNEHRPRYIVARRKDKCKVAREVVVLLQKQTPPGRFLEYDSITNLYNDIGVQKACKKAAQCLRENHVIVDVLLPELKMDEETKDCDYEDHYEENDKDSMNRSYPLPNIAEPGPNDVLCGTGTVSNNHIGNRRFRMLLDEYRSRYLAATKLDKLWLAREVVVLWRKQTPPGRFLQQDPITKLLKDIGHQKACEKVAHSMRGDVAVDVLPFQSPERKMDAENKDCEYGDHYEENDKDSMNRSCPIPNIAEPGPNDVLCGRGGASNNHIGNRCIRMLVNEHRSRYLAVGKLDKAKVAREVMVLWQTPRPGPNDILCGRGASNHHIGNRRFRMLLNEHRPRYTAARRLDKYKVAHEVMVLWRKQTPTGRFLQQDPITKLWNDIGDQKAREKTFQRMKGLRVAIDVLPFQSPEPKTDAENKDCDCEDHYEENDGGRSTTSARQIFSGRQLNGFPPRARTDDRKVSATGTATTTAATFKSN